MRPSTTMQIQPGGTRPKIEVVLKCDSAGSIEAITKSLSERSLPGAEVMIMRSGIGPVTKSDVLLAETASRIIIGFQVKVVPGLERLIRDHHVEVRLYDVIYALMNDVEEIVNRMTPPTAEEEVLGSAKVIELFKGSRRGVILGCQITAGTFAVGQHFRIITAMGPVYSGIVESLHSGPNPIQKASAGQQVGLKIENFKQAKKGDIVESFRPAASRKARHPGQEGGIFVR